MARGMTLRLELFVEDVAASVAFYRDVLGFSVDGEQADYVAVRSGDVTLGIGSRGRLPPHHPFSQAALNVRKGTGVEIVLEVDDVGAWYKRILGARYPISQPLGKRSWGLTDFRVVDPDGYYLRVTSRA